MASPVSLTCPLPAPVPVQNVPCSDDGGFGYILENWKLSTSGQPVPMLSTREHNVRMYGSAYDPARNGIDLTKWAAEVARQVKAFSAFFHSRMKAAGIDPSQSFSISTDAYGHLTVQGSGDTTKVQGLLDQDPELAYAYRSVLADCSLVAGHEIGSRYVHAWRKAATDQERALVCAYYAALSDKAAALSSSLEFNDGEFRSPALDWAQSLALE